MKTISCKYQDEVLENCITIYTQDEEISTNPLQPGDATIQDKKGRLFHTKGAEGW